MITAVTVKRFKTIHEVTLPLQRINILIGSNNSGKSSILQALQFAVSVGQTLRLLSTDWKRGIMKRSIPAGQLVYTPIRDIASLVRNRWFAETNYGIEVIIVGEPPPTTGGAALPAPKTSITMDKGRGEFIICAVNGAEIGKQIERLNPPFSVYVPGLAGIPAFEEHRSEVLVRKAAARGDANNVFRNILWLLSQNEAQWKSFLTDFRRVFPDRWIYVGFKSNKDEHIDAKISCNGVSLPIDAAGTGILQTIQILAYVNLYKPNLLILDEPDAHLHPNNQRRLAQVLVELAELRNFQVILSTHSRHLLDALRDDAKVHWIRKGNRVSDEEYSDIDVLMEVGALDRGDLLKAGKTKCVVLTEDDDISCIKTLMEASGLLLRETEFWPYKGCTNLETALALCAFISVHAPAAKILLHRDRDYMTDSEVEEYRAVLKKGAPQAFVFLTKGTDAESHFLNPKHLQHLEPTLDSGGIAEFIDRATKESEEYSVKKFINSRAPLESARLRKDNKQLNVGELAIDCTKLYQADTTRYRHGKKVLRALRNLLQNEAKLKPDPFICSEHIRDAELVEFANSVWPKV
ncbi:MAG TPA: ATP-binding protein [Verrucomicrobiales bacterium]|nr:ATP-binding protein [Verrucomicrobiales bacterium]